MCTNEGFHENSTIVPFVCYFQLCLQEEPQHIYIHACVGIYRATCMYVCIGLDNALHLYYIAYLHIVQNCCVCVMVAHIYELYEAA